MPGQVEEFSQIVNELSESDFDHLLDLLLELRPEPSEPFRANLAFGSQEDREKPL